MLRRPEIYLTWTSIKMWSRDRASLFWTFFLPLVIMVIFGLLNFGELGKLDVGIVDNAQNDVSSAFSDGLANIGALRIEHGTEATERDALTEGAPGSGDYPAGEFWERGTNIHGAGPLSLQPVQRNAGRAQHPSVGN